MEGQESGPSSLRFLVTMGEALMRDGTLAAAGRQGLDELGEALKAFPESIQVQEVGSIFNPTQGEIAAARDTQTPRDIANDNQVYDPGQEQQQEHGRER
jgi:hypothetical protein